jgi:hypothetical protein
MIRKTTDKSRGIRLGNFVQIRTIIDEELEQVWAGKKRPRKRLTRRQARQRAARPLRESQQIRLCPGPCPERPGFSLPWKNASVSNPPGCLGRWLRPQMAIILVFFFWPAAQALLPERAAAGRRFGGSTEFVGLENFRRLFRRSKLPRLVQDHGGLLDAGRGLRPVISLLLAVMANRVMRGAGIYKTLLIWPYAVAPVVAGVLWLFMFASPMGVIALWLAHSASTGTTCSIPTTP